MLSVKMQCGLQEIGLAFVCTFLTDHHIHGVYMHQLYMFYNPLVLNKEAL